MKIICNKILPPKDYTAINLFGVVFVKEGTILSPQTINHELIHTAQGKELLWIFFYIWYGIEWLVRLIQYRDRKLAYCNISFEREAYSNQNNMDYLKTRSFWAFVNYLKNDIRN